MNKIRILIVEDEAIVARDIQLQLSELGYDPVARTASGEQALSLAGQLRPDLVLMDIHLAGEVDGIAAAVGIRQQLRLPIIFLTAFNDDETLARAKLAEPYGYLIKPFNPRDLRTAIEMALYKHQAEARLRASEENLSITLHAIGDAVIATDAEGRITRMNPSAERLTGWSMAEAIDQPLGEIFRSINSQTREPTAGPVREVLSSGQIVRLTGPTAILSRDGHEHQISDSAAPIRDAAGRIVGVVLVFTDVTESYRVQEALRENEQRLNEAQRIARIGSWQMTADGRFSLSDQMFDLFPLSHDSPPTLEALFDTLAPDDRARESKAYREALDSDAPALESEYRVLWPDGQTRTILSIVRFHRNPGGQALAVAGTVQDITARKDAEAAQASLEAQLRESQKIEAIGTLAGGIAHDLNNIISIILGNSELACGDATNNPQTLESLHEIQKAGIRARDLVQQILAYSRRQPTTRKVISLLPIIDEAVRLLRATLPARVLLDVNCEADAPAVLADATQIEQILINLATNAAQAIGDAPGRIDIRLESLLPDEALLEKIPALQAMQHRHPGRLARLSLHDTGRGMDAATMQRIFEPFFTTKPVGEGTGLGLSVVHGIMRVHEGEIRVESEPGKGTTFDLYLPATQAPGTPPAQEPAPTATTILSQHILYIDDDESLVFLVKRLLEKRGYRVSGYLLQQQALDALRADPAAYDLVLTDYNMPGLSGLDVAREVREIRADLPVAIASGFISEELNAHAEGAGVRALISKPNAVVDLCDVIQGLLLATDS